MHTSFRRGITSMPFDLDQFFTDIHFFFKLSSARREDYLHSLTDTLDKFVVKGYLRYKTILCYKVALDAQLMNFFI